MELAEAADNEKIPVGMNLPDEIALREDRIKAITEANIKIEDRAKERFEQGQSEYQDKLGKREAKAKESGHKPRGKSPVPPVEGTRDKDQINLTDEASRIMKTAGRALHAKRKCTVEPVFGIIKAILGFRQFSLRGLENVKGELNLVAMAWNLKRMFVLAG